MESLEQEIRTQNEAYLKAWNDHDIEKLVSGGGTNGYGYRTREARDRETYTPESLRQGLQQFLDSFEYYRIIPGEFSVRVEGDIALTWGHFIEEFKRKGLPAERVRVRSTDTLRRTKDGQWSSLLAHRDAQQFDENGVYIPCFEE